MAIDYAVIGSRIKKARTNKKLTQAQLSEQIDVSIPFLSRVERGTAHINLKRLTQICEILDVDEGDIISGTSNKKENYLNKEFAELLNQCNPEKQKMIYNVVKAIVEG